MKNPEEVADALLLAFEIDNGHAAHIPASLVDSDLRVWMAEAIKADRAQIAAKLTEDAHRDGWGVPCVYVESFIQLHLEEEES